MKKDKYTKGPWIKGDDSTYGSYVVAGKGDSTIIVAETSPDENQDFEANAHLIAAAPEMLEALLAAVSTLRKIENNEVFRNEFRTQVDEAFHVIEQAIKKARGES